MQQQTKRIIRFGLAALLVGSLPLSAQRISLKPGKTTLKSVFERIEKSTNYKFEYNSSFNVNRKVSLTRNDFDALKLVGDLLKDSGYGYEVRGNYIVIAPVSKSPQTPKSKASKVESESRTLKGNVHDMNGEPIIGASVKVCGTAKGTVTDLDGNFTLEVSDDQPLVISYIGFDDQTINTQRHNSFDITMKESVQRLDELVVTAYGTQTRRNVSGAMQTIDMDNFKNIPGGQFSQKLQGQIAGVQINQSTGTPGSGMSVKIRGAASLSTGANPLYVVDGFPIVGDINNINPSEIESMSILKDAAATALYGSRAAFGVVIITTKKAKAGKTAVDVNAYMGLQNVPQKGRPDMMNGEEWAQFRKENYELKFPTCHFTGFRE